MALRFLLLAALAAVVGREAWAPADLPDVTLDSDAIAILLAAALGTDSLRLRR